ncbi:MAG: hypothetical protein JWR75_1801 [Devosia sp.]|nr:hypothetical protein [Devosia sp.]
MSFSLDTPSLTSLKAEARALRDDHAAKGAPITQSAALETIAKAHGYRDWNTAHASVPERVVLPFQVGQRVRGQYLGRDFAGVLLGVNLLSDMRHFKVTVKFDLPVNVSRFTSMIIERQRVIATVDVHGLTAATTSDGQPHLRLVAA